MKTTNDLKQLGQDTVAAHLAKAEGTTLSAAKKKLKKAEDKALNGG